MPEISERIIDHLRTLAKAILDEDYGSVSELYHLPVPVVRPIGAEMFVTEEDIAADFRSVWHHWSAAGTTSISPTLIGLRSFAYGVYLADIEWSLLNSNGTETALIHTTYGFRDSSGHLGITSIFSHDEQFQRPLAV